ncbi:bile acid:sodium symporter family protein [Nocardia harenae]|uniref:bile acid:sodium symporter family protein n=1 Tax=Nocardia harenae TaxID=358707 RepID=UPI00082AB98D|nr:bile acid:sodium symporter family protein [Nocardia harenae]
MTALLSIVLTLITFGLGLSLTVADFTRVVRYPRAVLVALGCQLVVLPAIAFGLVVATGLAPASAVGVVLLMAAPGGATANLLSHLFRADVALNVTLTAINSLPAMVTLPVVANLALAYFAPAGQERLGLQSGKLLQVFAMVLLPVLAGMLTRAVRPGWGARLDRPVRVLALGFLAVATVAALIVERREIGGYLAEVGALILALCAIALGLGLLVPALAGVPRPQALACATEVGIHHSALAMTIAVSVLGDLRTAVPAGVYSVVSVPLALLAGWLISVRSARSERNPAPRSRAQLIARNRPAR